MSLMATLVGLGIAAPWILRGVPMAGRGIAAAGRGSKEAWKLGKGLGTPEGRRRAARAVWQKEGSIPRSPSGKFEAGSRSPGAAQRTGKWTRQNPWKATALGGGAGAGIGYGLDAMFGGQPAPEVGDVQGTRTGTEDRIFNTPWSPSEGLMSARDAKRAQSEAFWGNMNKMMQMSAILNATGGDTKGFQGMMTLANKKILSDMGDQREMDIYDSVFKKDNMPNTAIEAYERMISSQASPEQAAKVAGQYVTMRHLKVNTTENLNKLIQEVQAMLSTGDRDSAGARLHTALIYGEIPTDAFEDQMGNLLTGAVLKERIEDAIKGMEGFDPG